MMRAIARFGGWASSPTDNARELEPLRFRRTRFAGLRRLKSAASVQARGMVGTHVLAVHACKTAPLSQGDSHHETQRTTADGSPGRPRIAGRALAVLREFLHLPRADTQPACTETPSAASARTNSVTTTDSCAPKPSCPTDGQIPGTASATTNGSCQPKPACETRTETSVCQPKTTCETRVESTSCVPKSSCQEQPECVSQKSDNCGTAPEWSSGSKNCQPTTAPATAKTGGDSRWNESCGRPVKTCETAPVDRSSSQNCQPKASDPCVRQTSSCNTGATAKSSSDGCETQDVCGKSSRNNQCAEPAKAASSPSNDCAFADQPWLARLLRA